jgi:hypothetical protein
MSPRKFFAPRENRLLPESYTRQTRAKGNACDATQSQAHLTPLSRNWASGNESANTTAFVAAYSCTCSLL